jgi:hypothetical protein
LEALFLLPSFTLPSMVDPLSLWWKQTWSVLEYMVVERMNVFSVEVERVAPLCALEVFPTWTSFMYSSCLEGAACRSSMVPRPPPCFLCLLEFSTSYMWALGVGFSAVWIGLLVAQASAFSIEVLRVSRLHASVLRPLGVMFTSCLDLCRASWSSHKVLDELFREVSLLVLQPCVNNKLQIPHASANMTYHEG